ncbi:MAG: zinc ribbon domain-containing protein [Candidatus Bathyarchaeota archaeon]|nr:zinc ribbon domain-containing protein [Candidatus Bathyarchaeota archaeon]
MGNVEFEKIKRPENIKLPYILDFYPLEDEKNTRISQFFKNLKEGRLTTTKCKECGELLWPPRVVCSGCLSDELEWVDLGVEGELYAFTEMRAGAPLGFVQDVPFCIGMVKIGGLLISARIDNAKYEDLKISEKVQLKIVELEDERVFYRFQRIS